ncbi:hypothetical protein FUA48_11165 [Flavobacterium alkalisoli]|uniref:Uncharacterized protein n=1 Tax=Flavobacterium alkalisoli TaxID=2602769 RepID=A0A5B9FV06_9FLAO|nr:hypothetical protein [Flavobacterium alkalisoli]QEE50119.1 hypothetical protein FUA48_11165 [Flavobacterium alkalisoli]
MKNISLKQYTTLPDTLLYDAILEHLQPKNSFAGKSMNTNLMPYANVKYCIRLLPKIESWEGICQLFTICFDVTKDEFWNAPITDYFAAKKHVVSQFEEVIKTESHVLASYSTDAHLWQMAGADRLKPYSDTLPLVQLGKMFGQYPFDLGRKPYGEIFSLLAQTKTQNEVENDYQKLARQ